MSPTGLFLVSVFGVLLMAGVTNSQVMSCGTQRYDRFTHLCCAGQVLRIDAGIPPANAICCNGEVLNNATEGCCADQNSFTIMDELCCEGKVTTDGGFATHECCGDNTFYKIDMKMCCDRNVVNGNPAVDLCCGQETIEKAFYRCCGYDQAYDFRSGVCCNNVVSYNYPGGESEWQCCGTSVFRKTSSEQACCGTTNVYDPRTHMCCGSETISSTSSEYGCCNIGDLATRFRVATHSCCNEGTTVLPGTECPDTAAEKQDKARKEAEAKAAAARKAVAESVAQSQAAATMAAAERAQVQKSQQVAAAQAAISQWQAARNAAVKRAAAYMAAARKAAQAGGTNAQPHAGQQSPDPKQKVYPVLGIGDITYVTNGPAVVATTEAPTTADTRPVASARGYAAWLKKWQEWVGAYTAYAAQQQPQQGQQPAARSLAYATQYTG